MHLFYIIKIRNFNTKIKYSFFFSWDFLKMEFFSENFMSLNET